MDAMGDMLLFGGIAAMATILVGILVGSWIVLFWSK